MSWTPENSTIKTTKSIDEAIMAAASQAEVQRILRDAALEQGVVRPDLYDPSVLLEVEPSTVPRQVGKVVVLNGVKHSLVASDEAGLLAQESAIYREALTQPAATQQVEQPRSADGRFLSAAEQGADVERKAVLNVQFQLGTIDAATYLEQSGAIDSYLTSRGINVEDLQSASQEKRDAVQTSSWELATEQFLAGPGQDWPGGENMNVAGKIIAENGLTDQPSVETLSKVWQFMKDNGLVVENEALTTHRRIADATSPAEIRAALGRSSSMFGR